MLRGFNPLLMSLLTVNFKIVPETLVSDTVGFNHLLMSLLILGGQSTLTLNCTLRLWSLVSDNSGVSVLGGQSSFNVLANSEP